MNELARIKALAQAVGAWATGRSRELIILGCFAVVLPSFYHLREIHVDVQHSWLSGGDWVYSVGDDVNAEKLYQMHILDYPTDTEAHYRLADLYIQRTPPNFDEAAYILHRALERDGWRDSVIMDILYNVYCFLFIHIWEG